MATYNRRRFIPQALRCFQRRTYANAELLIIDDSERPVGALCTGLPGVRYIRLTLPTSTGAITPATGLGTNYDAAFDVGLAVITAKVPLAEVTKYAAQLGGITQGQGSYTMEFSHYDLVPGNVRQQIVAKSKLAKDEDEE